MLNKNDIQNIQKLYGDSFYILDTNQFAKNFQKLKHAFSAIYPNFNIAYSYKTNYTPRLCELINSFGGYAEVVSEMEMQLALAVGVDPNRIIWNGPIKNIRFVEIFLLKGGAINIDSLDELNEIKKIIENNPGSTFNLGVRCNFDVNDGVVSRFGTDISSCDFKEILQYIVDTPNVNLFSLQCHFAKRDLAFWIERTKGMINLVNKIGLIPCRIDLGGGMYGNMKDSLKCQFKTEIPSYEEYAQEVATLIAEAFPNGVPELIVEPGSALVGDCMYFICPIKGIKKVRGKYFATVLGSQKNINMQSINPPIDVISMGEEQNFYYDIDIVGYTCIENDVIYHNYCGNLAKNDVIVISNCGSYSLVMKPPFILPNFPVLDYSNGILKLIKREETYDDVFQTYVFSEENEYEV